jgi:hypothetical protein
MSWLDPVRQALDEGPCTVFFRDDDAGWGDERLSALLDLFDRRGLPVDLAVIPAELRPTLTAELTVRAPAGAVHLHQHGVAHVNHEPAGRKCEFGPARSYAAQAADITRGAAILADAFGDLVAPVFTPPWNRCSAVTADVLADAGFAVLSRDSTATRWPGHASPSCRSRSTGSAPARTCGGPRTSWPGDWQRRSAPAVRSASCCTTRSQTTASSPRSAPCPRC